jgi:putative tricarboxylic transport membrane protein
MTASSALALAAGVAALAAGPAIGASADWKPDRVVEIVVNTAAGASPDRTARSMQRIFQERRLLEVPVTVQNRVGGAGAVAYTYLNTKQGDAHYIAIASKLILASHIMGRGPYYGEFTPLAHLFGEYIVIAVKADSPIKSGRDLIERLKKDPAAHSFGIATSLGNVNHQSVAGPLKEAGVDLRKTKNVIFQASTTAITALLGGHVDAVPIVLGTAVPLLQTNQIRVLAITAPKRAPGVFADVPTWREQGYNVVTSNWRSVIGPKALTPAQIGFWERTIQRMVETDDWKKDLEAGYLANEYLGSAETRKLMDRDYAQVKAFLTELELVK